MVLTRLVAGLILLASLASCGADGAPVPPDDRQQPQSGITLSGKVQVGVAGGSDGTRTVTRITN